MVVGPAASDEGEGNGAGRVGSEGGSRQPVDGQLESGPVWKRGVAADAPVPIGLSALDVQHDELAVLLAVDPVDGSPESEDPTIREWEVQGGRPAESVLGCHRGGLLGSPG